MKEGIIDEKLLSKNSISQFILKFDLQTNIEIDFSLIINDLSKHFDRNEKTIQTNFQVNFTTDKSEINQIEGYNYVLVNDNHRYSLQFSNSQNSIIFNTSNYIDKSTYSTIITELIKSANTHKIQLISKRIGMRFVNNFSCNSLKSISKFLNTTIAKNLAHIGLKEKLSRIVCQEEYNYDDSKVRLQYGIPNRFYPAILKNYDLLVDIDSYDDTLQENNNWENIISTLNHSAYNTFINTINQNLLTTLK